MNDETAINLAKLTLSGFTGENLDDYIRQLEYVREPLLTSRVERYKTLCKAREQYRHPKDKDYTDFDRKTMLEAFVADIQADYELVAGLEKLVCERVELIKLLMEQE